MRAWLMAATLAGCSDYEVDNLTRHEQFQQPDLDTSADVLFVVDNSASMAEEQERLAANFDAFVEVIEDSYADFRMGIITTDIADEGTLIGGWFTPDTPDLADTFRAAVEVGTDGSRDELAFESVVLALGNNPDFLRDEARLNLAFLSDEDEHSPADVPSYIQLFKQAGAGGGFIAHAVVGDQPVGCASGTTAADAGERYIELVKSTEGFRDSICAEDYSDILAKIGLSVVGWTDTFYLDDLPDTTTLEVRVDGVLIPEREDDGWRYSIGDNAVVFDGRSIPRPGMYIDVQFEPLMGGPSDDSAATTSEGADPE